MRQLFIQCFPERPLFYLSAKKTSILFRMPLVTRRQIIYHRDLHSTFCFSFTMGHLLHQCFYVALLMLTLHLTYVTPVTPKQVLSLSRSLQHLCDTELQAAKFNRMFDNTTVRYTPLPVDGNNEVQMLANSVAVRIQAAANIVDANGALIENFYHPGLAVGSSTNPTCCPNSPLNGSWYTPADNGSMCNSFFSLRARNKVPPSFLATLQNNLLSNMLVDQSVTRQYAGDIWGTYYQYPSFGPQSCSKSNRTEDNDFRYQSWYVNTVSPKKKNIVVIIDESSSMQFYAPKYKSRMAAAKEAAKTVVNTLSARDWAGVVAFSNEVRTPKGCFGDKIAQANSRNKKVFNDFIDAIIPINRTVYSRAFKRAFDMLDEIKNTSSEQFEDSLDTIIFLTDGGPSDKIEDIRKVIADGNRKMNQSVSIFFYALGVSVGVSTPIPAILSLADQNNQRLQHTHNAFGVVTVHSSSVWPGYSGPVGPAGHFEWIPIQNASNLREMMGSYYLNYPQSVSRSVSFTLPFVDPQHGLVMTMAKPLVDMISGKLFGVTAADVKFNSLFDEVTHYRKGLYSYAFLVTRGGKVLSHRNFARPSLVQRNIDFVTLDIAEPSLPPSIIKEITTSGSTGSYRSQVSLAMSRGISQLDGSYKLKLNATFHYQPLPHFEDSFSLVVVLFDADKEIISRQLLNPSPTTSIPTVNYHRLDLKNPSNRTSASKSSLCVTKNSAIRQTAVSGRKQFLSTVKLAPIAFKNPNKYLTQSETSQDVKDLEILLKSQSSSKSGVLKSVAVEDALCTQDFDSVMNAGRNTLQSEYRYLATKSGVFRISPGTMLSVNYDPTQQPWYQQTTVYQDRCVFTRAGYSPTGDQSLASLATALHSSANQDGMVGAVGADVPYTYFGSLVRTTIPECSDPKWACFLLDHSGYLITEAPQNSTKSRLLRHKHVTEVEPDVVEDLSTLYPHIVKTRWCRQTYSSKLSQMFYDIDTNYTSVSGSVLSPSCKNYTLYSIPRTNLHCLVLQTLPSCSPSSLSNSSCTCTPNCVSCNLTQTTCQCPCQCDVGADPCTNRYELLLPPVTCPAPWEPLDPPTLNMVTPQPPPCPSPCHTRLTKRQCLSSTGTSQNCSWCNSTSGSVCLNSCPTVPPSVTTTTSSPNTSTASMTSTMSGTTSSTRASTDNSTSTLTTAHQFCSRYCPSPVPVNCPPAVNSQKSAKPDDDYKGLAAGLGVPLGVLGAVSAAGLIAFLLKRRPPIPVEIPPTKIRPVESFNPNIYRASMGDDMIPNVARNGARLSNNWNSGGQAMFGRTNTIPE